MAKTKEAKEVKEVNVKTEKNISVIANCRLAWKGDILAKGKEFSVTAEEFKRVEKFVAKA